MLSRRILIAGIVIYLAAALALAAVIGSGTRGETVTVVRDPVLHCYGVWRRDIGLAGVNCSWRWHW